MTRSIYDDRRFAYWDGATAIAYDLSLPDAWPRFNNVLRAPYHPFAYFTLVSLIGEKAWPKGANVRLVLIHPDMTVSGITLAPGIPVAEAKQ